MLVDRCIVHSIRDEVKRLLELDIGELRKFNVYEESQMSQMQTGDFVPTSPYCFLVLSKVEPTKTQLPFIAIDALPIRKDAMELGNRAGRVGVVRLHVLGNTEGEVWDLASYLVDGIGARFEITNHNEQAYRGYGAHERMALAEVMIEPAIQSPGEIAEALILEGTMHHWQIIMFSYRVLL